MSQKRNCVKNIDTEFSPPVSLLCVRMSFDLERCSTKVPRFRSAKVIDRIRMCIIIVGSSMVRLALPQPTTSTSVYSRSPPLGLHSMMTVAYALKINSRFSREATRYGVGLSSRLADSSGRVCSQHCPDLFLVGCLICTLLFRITTLSHMEEWSWTPQTKSSS